MIRLEARIGRSEWHGGKQRGGKWRGTVAVAGCQCFCHHIAASAYFLAFVDHTSPLQHAQITLRYVMLCVTVL
ncbi:hypothetical protein J6590_043677 [Homalodisca vitripennis]|nr:hypothetical protein J6590_043677 [Homalodisca vitripennis]